MDFTEKTVRRNYIYRGKILSLRCDDAARPDGKPCKREIVEHSGGAAILCVVNGKVVLVRQYRYAYGEVLYEIPAGKLEKGEDPSSAARRELSEETGYETDSAELLSRSILLRGIRTKKYTSTRRRKCAPGLVIPTKGSF